jgi:hypothetical protein
LPQGFGNGVHSRTIKTGQVTNLHLARRRAQSHGRCLARTNGCR